MSIKFLSLTFLVSAITISNSLRALLKLEQVKIGAGEPMQSHHLVQEVNQQKTQFPINIDTKTSKGIHSRSPRIMKYLPPMNINQKIQASGIDIEQEKRKFIRRLGNNKLVDRAKVEELTAILATQMGKSILQHFKQLTQKQLNFYQPTEPQWKRWIAIKILAGKDAKMYWRTIAEDTKLFKQFYLNSRNKQIGQIFDFLEAYKQPFAKTSKNSSQFMIINSTNQKQQMKHKMNQGSKTISLHTRVFNDDKQNRITFRQDFQDESSSKKLLEQKKNVVSNIFNTPTSGKISRFLNEQIKRYQKVHDYKGRLGKDKQNEALSKEIQKKILQLINKQLRVQPHQLSKKLIPPQEKTVSKKLRRGFSINQ